MKQFSELKKMSFYLDAIGDAFLVLDAQRKVVEANQVMQELLGYSKAEMLACSFGKLFPPAEHKKHALEMRKSVRFGTPRSFETFLLTKKRKHIPVELSGTALKNDKGNLWGFAGVFRNITKRKQAEEALRESEARYRALFEGAAEGIVIADIQTKKFKYANPAICELLGYNHAELLTLGVPDIHPKESLEHILSLFEAQARGKEKLAADIPCLRKDGAVIYVDINTAKVEINGAACNVGFFTDITERRKADEDLRAKNIALNEILGQIEIEKANIKSDVQANVDHILLPALEKIKNQKAGVSKTQFVLLEQNLKELASSFGRKLSHHLYRLTPKEIEICNMIKGGLSTKEIAQSFNCSHRTVETHRNEIRKKLSIAHEKVNLVTFLQSL